MRSVLFGELEVSAIGLGCMTMSGAYGEADQAEAQATLLRAVELGVTLFDTANVYGAGANEELVGRVLAPHREQVCIATKFGFVFDREAGPRIDGSPDQVAHRCDESLARLGTDYIDLYLLHRPDPQVPIEDTVGAMGQVVAAGKVRHIGVCEVSADTLRRANATHPISAVQSEFSLWTRDPENNGVLAVCQELGVGFMPYSPLGRAMLTGELTSADQVKGHDFRGGLPRFQEEHFEKNRALVARHAEVAAGLGVTPAELALAWVLSRGASVAPIPGTRRRRWLEQNVAAIDIAVDAETAAVLDDVFSAANVSGGRYAEDLMSAKDTPRRS